MKLAKYHEKLRTVKNIKRLEIVHKSFFIISITVYRNK